MTFKHSYADKLQFTCLFGRTVAKVTLWFLFFLVQIAPTEITLWLCSEYHFNDIEAMRADIRFNCLIKLLKIIINTSILIQPVHLRRFCNVLVVNQKLDHFDNTKKENWFINKNIIDKNSFHRVSSCEYEMKAPTIKK